MLWLLTVSALALINGPRCTAGPASLRLQATLVADNAPSAAVIEPTGGLSRVISEGGHIRGYRLRHVSREALMLRARDGGCWRLTRRPAAPTRTTRPAAPARVGALARIEVTPGRGATVDRATLDRLIENPKLLRREIRLRFRHQDGEPQLAIRHIRSQGIFGRIGLRRGDRLVGINGRRITSPNDALAVMAGFLDTGRAEVVVRRGDQVLVFEANVR